MTIAVAYWCVLIAAALPYVWTAVAKASGERYDNRDPRAWIARQAAPRVQRANGAQLNAFEAFPAFTAGVVLCQLAGVDEARVAGFAVAFVVARIVHGVCYVAGAAVMRSVAWLAGIACVFSLLASAASHAA